MPEEVTGMVTRLDLDFASYNDFSTYTATLRCTDGGEGYEVELKGRGTPTIRPGDMVTIRGIGGGSRNMEVLARGEVLQGVMSMQLRRDPYRSARTFGGGSFDFSRYKKAVEAAMDRDDGLFVALRNTGAGQPCGVMDDKLFGYRAGEDLRAGDIVEIHSDDGRLWKAQPARNVYQQPKRGVYEVTRSAP